MSKYWNKNITLFLLSQSISLFGSALVQYAITWYITLETNSGLMAAISIICGFLPSFILSPFAGVWADRYSRKKLIIIADFMIAAFTLILAIVFMSGHKMFWLLFLASALRSTGSAIQTPAVSAFLPQFVPPEGLMKVNAVNGSIQSLTMLAAPMLSGMLYYAFPIEIIFFIDVVTAAVAIIILLFFIKVPPHAKALEKQKNSYFSDMKIGFEYINNHSFLKQFFLIATCFSILAVPAAFLTPLQVARSFGEEPWRLPSIEVAFLVGMSLGGLVMTSWGGFRNKIHTMAFATFFLGVTTFALGVVSNFAIYLAVMALMGISLPVFNTPSMVLLQEKVEESFLGRVFSIFSMISSIMMPLGILIFGPVADIIKIEWMLIFTGLLIFAEGFFVLYNKTLLKAVE